MNWHERRRKNLINKTNRVLLKLSELFSTKLVDIRYDFKLEQSFIWIMEPSTKDGLSYDIIEPLAEVTTMYNINFQIVKSEFDTLGIKIWL